MPRTPIDYNNTVIYKLVCNDVNVSEVYVGHTTNFVKRKAEHATCCRCPGRHNYHYYVYEFIRNNFGFDNFSMIEIEKYPCKDKQEACKRERYWIEKMQATLNRTIPTRTHAEYYRDNQDYLKNKSKNYYDKNRDIVAERGKIYRELNAEKLRLRKHEYYLRNRDKMTKHTVCQCGGSYTLNSRNKHFKTNLHRTYENNNYEYQWENGTPCTEEEYKNSLL